MVEYRCTIQSLIAKHCTGQWFTAKGGISGRCIVKSENLHRRLEEQETALGEARASWDRERGRAAAERLAAQEDRAAADRSADAAADAVAGLAAHAKALAAGSRRAPANAAGAELHEAAQVSDGEAKLNVFCSETARYRREMRRKLQQDAIGNSSGNCIEVQSDAYQTRPEEP